MEEWQQAALTNRHFHNRTGRGNKGKGKGSGIFDVRSTFGTFKVECARARLLSSTPEDDAEHAQLVIYGLNAAENALFGELTLPNVLDGAVILAGSRKVMSAAIKEATPKKTQDEQQTSTASTIDGVEEGGNDTESAEESQGEEEDESAETAVDRRAKTFEKNSFRSPKFWFSWQGHTLHNMGIGSTDPGIETNTGYIVFSGNSCDKFEGTLNSGQLDWDNVKIKGWKVASKPQRDYDMKWQAS